MRRGERNRTLASPLDQSRRADEQASRRTRMTPARAALDSSPDPPLPRRGESSSDWAVVPRARLGRFSVCVVLRSVCARFRGGLAGARAEPSN
jgi:hypothetical protein